MTPITLVWFVFRDRAAALGWYPISRATFRIRVVVASEIKEFPPNARETVEWETPVILAMSLIVIAMGRPSAHVCSCF
jgi:hypothetical protein